MKKNLFFTIITSIFVITSCENKEEIYPWPADPWYTFNTEIADTVLSADQHQFTIEITPMEDAQIQDWEHILINGIWDESLPGEDDKWLINSGDCSWIKLEKLKKNGKSIIQVTMNSNETSERRGIRFYVYTKVKKLYAHYCSHEIKIWQNGKEEKEGPFEVKVRYKGQIHRSMATLDENEHIVYEDADFAAFMKELAQRGGIEAIARENGIIDYYDKDDVEAVAAIQLMMEPINDFSAIEPRWCSFATRSDANPYRYMNANALAYCALFDDKGYKDTHIHQNFMNLTDYYDQERMKNVGLNDKVTSLAVAYNGNDSTICAVLTVWEDTDYNWDDDDRTKHRMSFVASYNNPTMGWRNLKHVPCLTGGDSWNDRISSISFHFGHYGSYLLDY